MAKIEKDKRIQIPLKRVYTPEELADFNAKIQRFYEDHTLTTGEINKVLNWDELGVAYGAFVKKPGSHGQFYYLETNSETKPSRYEQFINIMDQLDFWKRGKDWKKERAMEHQMKSYEQFATETGVQDGLF